jgi:hypothetical protein
MNQVRRCVSTTVRRCGRAAPPTHCRTGVLTHCLPTYRPLSSIGRVQGRKARAACPFARRFYMASAVRP